MIDGQAPAPAPSNDDRIAAFGASFIENLDTDRNPNQGLAPETEEVEAQPEQQEQEVPEQEANAQPETEMDRFELDGEELAVPKHIAEKLKEIRNSGLRQEDYTRKTQEVAASRKQLEQITQAAQRAMSEAEQLAPAYAQLFAMQNDAQAIQRNLTPELESTDPLAFNNALAKLSLLTQQISHFQTQIGQVKQQHQQQLTQVRQQAMAEKLPAVLREFPDIAKPETQTALRQFAESSGLPDEAIEWMKYSPEAVKILYMAQSYQKMMATRKTATESLKSKVAVSPGAKPTAKPQPVESQKLTEAWRKNGSKMTDPNFDALLRKRIGT